MASIRSLLQDTLGQLIFREFAVESVQDISAHFRRFRVRGESVRDNDCAPGDKLQILISGAGTRTFTPFSPNANAGTLEFLAYVHGDAPAAKWARDAGQGLRFRAFGPRGSLPLGTLSGPVILLGDETSVGAAKSLLDTRGTSEGLAFVFEATDRDETERALAELGLTARAIVRRQLGRAHLAELETQLRAAASQQPGAHLVLTGHAQTIQAMRAALRARPAPVNGQKVKAYWADGKRGLD